MVLRFVLGGAALLIAFATWVWSSIAIDSGEAVSIGGNVLTGGQLRFLAILLALAGGLLVVSAALKAVRRILTVVALIAFLGTGVGAAVLRQSENSWLQDRAGCGKNLIGADRDLSACVGR